MTIMTEMLLKNDHSESTTFNAPLSPVSTLEITMLQCFVYLAFFKLGLIFYLLNNPTDVKPVD